MLQPSMEQSPIERNSNATDAIRHLSSVKTILKANSCQLISSRSQDFIIRLSMRGKLTRG
jgi:hypothetical protein